MTHPTLFDPVALGELHLANRVVMAPMTRSRADEANGDVVTDLHVAYYARRATAGLVITEGTQPSITGKGYCRTPGVHTPAQVDAWRKVTDAVHAAGGTIVVQLMHVGRIACKENKPEGADTVAPSAIRGDVSLFTDAVGMAHVVEPRALRTDEVPLVVEEFRAATACAMAAGFDGVELHAASGYLPMQFLSTGTNRRDDRYGGSAENRVRFVVECLDAMAAEAGAGRVGVRICPGNTFNDLHDDDPERTYATLLGAIDHHGLAYLHVIRSPDPAVDAFAIAAAHWNGPTILNDSFDFASATEAVRSGACTAVSFARHYLANPDLVARFRTGAPLARFDRKTLYTPGPEGYTDSPALDAPGAN